MHLNLPIHLQYLPSSLHLQVLLLASLGLVILLVPVHQQSLTELLGTDFQLYRSAWHPHHQEPRLRLPGSH